MLPCYQNQLAEQNLADTQGPWRSSGDSRGDGSWGAQHHKASADGRSDPLGNDPDPGSSKQPANVVFEQKRYNKPKSVYY